ncbi:AAA family ATPase [Janibacter indicus]|uniref:AAA family ATPase n=1 Tax=Janibacter indicus TaxID=857417 RepID=UPI003D9A4BAE
MAKYDALAEALQKTQAMSRTLTFDELDALVPGGLPPSARQYREWWANAVSADGQAASWLGAGWRVETVNLPVQVTFVKQSDAAAPDLEVNVIRRSVLLPALLQTLADAGRPLPRSEALQMMSERVTFTPYELGMAGKTGRTRWSNNTTWMTTSLAAIGWIDKTPQGWSITDAGQAALEQFRSGDSLLAEHNRLYALHVAEQKEGQEYAKPAYDVIRAALSLLGDGQWTSVTDMIEVSGVGASQVKAFVLATSPEGAHRLLLDGGRVDPDAVLEAGQGSQRSVLESEGLGFTAEGRADETKHQRAEDLRGPLEELGALKPLPRRAWLVRGSNVNGHDLVPLWRDQGFVSLPATKLRPVEPGLDRTELKAIVAEDYASVSYNSRASKVDELHAFLSRMREGDLVGTVSQGNLYLGTVTGPAAYAPTEDGRSNLRRAVTWASGEGVDYGDLPPSISSRLQVQYEVVELTAQIDALERLLGSPAEVATATEVEEVVLVEPTPELAARLNVDLTWLTECVDLLRDRPQLIFYGPPGTGKTYLALELAAHLAGDNVRLVQFHPSYSYEDFFEGYRPTREGAFALKPGPMRKVVDQARENPSTPYFLIIDEINRGNLAKIFGELYFLLEYRERNVDLLYADGGDDAGFSLPSNVFIIGTMNTADRSIALVDAAMRRRFAFLPLHPDEVPTKDVLRRWLDAEGLDPAVADLLDALNARIHDVDFKIGPSYFMRPAVHETGGIERVWRTAILPLLEEHHYGDGTDVAKRYGLDAVRASLRPAQVLVDDDPRDGGGLGDDEVSSGGPAPDSP